MNPEIKARWVAALRDPDAKQLKGRLGKPDGRRCCLGVLCDLAVADGVIDPPVIADDGDLVYARSWSTLPAEVATWAGLPYSNPVIAANLASDWNDDYNATFPEIAYLIEEHL